MIPAAILVIENGIGNNAPTTIKKPPHFLIFFKCFFILTSKYSLTVGVFEMAFPIKKETIPPIYESKARMDKNKIGDALLSAQAMNISGGIKPKKDSDAKNNANILIGE